MMRSMLMPLALCGMLASTVGCAQRVPTSPVLPAPEPAANAPVADLRQVQQMEDPAGPMDDPDGQMEESASTMASDPPAMGKRTRHTTRARSHRGPVVRKHKFLFFKGAYIEVDTLIKPKKKRHMGTTRRRSMSTMRRG